MSDVRETNSYLFNVGRIDGPGTIDALIDSLRAVTQCLAPYGRQSPNLRAPGGNSASELSSRDHGERNKGERHHCSRSH